MYSIRYYNIIKKPCFQHNNNINPTLIWGLRLRLMTWLIRSIGYQARRLAGSLSTAHICGHKTAPSSRSLSLSNRSLISRPKRTKTRIFSSSSSPSTSLSLSLCLHLSDKNGIFVSRSLSLCSFISMLLFFSLEIAVTQFNSASFHESKDLNG